MLKKYHQINHQRRVAKAIKMKNHQRMIQENEKLFEAHGLGFKPTHRRR